VCATLEKSLKSSGKQTLLQVKNEGG